MALYTIGEVALLCDIKPSRYGLGSDGMVYSNRSARTVVTAFSMMPTSIRIREIKKLDR